MEFTDLGLSDDTLRAVSEAGYKTPTPIQEQAIPLVLMGRDVLGVAQTGTGKTAGFTLPMIEILSGGRAKARMPRSLILAPTRELASQIGDNFVKYGKYHSLTMALLIGGESMDNQEKVLDRGVDVLVATPGRLIDLYERGRIIMNDVKVLVIDEADRMLDMGFIPDVERIVSLIPKIRQTLFFSATMNSDIRRLAEQFLMNPREVHVSSPATAATTVVQAIVTVRTLDKRECLRRLIRAEHLENAFIFCNRKRDVDVVFKSLTKHGFNAVAMHGDMPQSKRIEMLAKFKAGTADLLVCSDVAARGIDITGVSHVINFDVPFNAEDYIHRIGRTGRAGMQGHAVTIATPAEFKSVQAIERLIKQPIPLLQDPAVADLLVSGSSAAEEEPAGDGRRSRGGRSDKGGRDRPRSGKSRTPRNEPRHEAPRNEAPRHEVSRVETPPEEAPQPMAAEPAQAAPVAAPDAPRREPERRPRPDRERKRHERPDRDHHRDRGDSEPNDKLGFGDSVPAFLQTRVPAYNPESVVIDGEDDNT